MLIPNIILQSVNQFWLSDLDKKQNDYQNHWLSKQEEYQTDSTSETMSTDSNNRTMSIKSTSKTLLRGLAMIFAGQENPFVIFRK